MVHRKLKQVPADILPRRGEKILLASANVKYGLGGQSSTAVISALMVIVLDVYTGHREIYVEGLYWTDMEQAYCVYLCVHSVCTARCWLVLQ